MSSNSFIIKPVERHIVRVRVIGETPLLTNRFNPGVLNNPPDEVEDEFLESLYLRPNDGGYGFPAMAFKRAMIRTAMTHLKSLDGTQIKGTIFSLGDLVPLTGSEPERYDTHESTPQKKKVKVVYGRFWPWECDLVIQYVRTSETPWSKTDVLSLLYNAGQLAGVGRRRPEGGGSNGIFTVGDAEFVRFLAKQTEDQEQ
jgi:hypothetical protein